MNYPNHLNMRKIQCINFQRTLPPNKLRLDLMPIAFFDYS